MKAIWKPNIDQKYISGADTWVGVDSPISSLRGSEFVYWRAADK